MKLLMAGLAARDSAALGILAGMAMKGWQAEACEGRVGKALPAADLYIVDVTGTGLGRWSASAEANLLQMLHGKPAVLLHAASDRSWLEGGTSGALDQVLVWLAKPYSTEAMREALVNATRKPVRRAPSAVIGRRPAVAPAPSSMPAASPRVAPPARPGVLQPAAAARPGVIRPAAAPRPPVATDVYSAPTRRHCALDETDLASLYRTFPELRRHAVLDRIVQAAAGGQPAEVRITLQQTLVMDPLAGWVATNAATEAIERACRQNELASVLSVRSLSSEQARSTAERLSLPRQSLDAFLWALAASVIGSEPIRLAADPKIHLQGFPDYTRLKGVPDFFIQLAAICVRLPQRLSALQAAFPRQDPQLVRQFALLASVSGLGRLDLATATPVGMEIAGLTRPVASGLQVRKPAVPVKQGFFKAMLSRLF